MAALIGSGLSPQQMAKRLGISEGTLRTELKHVFKKIGVSRQGELVALLTRLVLPLLVSASSPSAPSKLQIYKQLQIHNCFKTYPKWGMTK